jgi:cell wall-associated NlpC family hydrolase
MTDAPTWLTEFIGVPYREGGYDLTGWACWGPVYEAYRRRGITLPTYSEQSGRTPADQREINAMMARDVVRWIEVPLAEARLWDVLVFRLAGRWHCGLVVDPPWFVHCLAKSKTTRERWDTRPWNRGDDGLLQGVYRWNG